MRALREKEALVLHLSRRLKESTMHLTLGCGLHSNDVLTFVVNFGSSLVVVGSPLRRGRCLPSTLQSRLHGPIFKSGFVLLRMV